MTSKLVGILCAIVALIGLPSVSDRIARLMGIVSLAVAERNEISASNGTEGGHPDTR